jgi:DNA-binding transcriptional ArsR family regulator
MRMTASAISEIKADMFRALGHPVRVRILEALGRGERSVGDLQAVLGLDVGGASAHLTTLRQQGLVESRREGTSVFYRVKDPRVLQVLELARQMLTAQLQDTQTLLGDLAATGPTLPGAEERGVA